MNKKEEYYKSIPVIIGKLSEIGRNDLADDLKIYLNLEEQEIEDKKQKIKSIEKQNKQNEILQDKVYKKISKDFHKYLGKYFKEEFIPKQKIKDKIKEINNMDIDVDNLVLQGEIRTFAIKHLKSLLKEG
jgi:hypothetical protein